MRHNRDQVDKCDGEDLFTSDYELLRPRDTRRYRELNDPCVRAAVISTVTYSGSSRSAETAGRAVAVSRGEVASALGADGP